MIPPFSPLLHHRIAHKGRVMRGATASTGNLLLATCVKPLARPASGCNHHSRNFSFIASNASSSAPTRAIRFVQATDLQGSTREDRARRSFHSTRRTSASKDPYSILGVAKDASSSDIKKAYYAVRTSPIIISEPELKLTVIVWTSVGKEISSRFK